MLSAGFNHKNADWDKFQQVVKENLRKVQIPQTITISSMDRLAQAFTITIITAADATMPQIRPCKRSKPWWTEDLNKLQKALYKALRRYKKSRSIQDHTAWKRTRNQYFHAIREAKTQHQENFLMNATGKEVFTAAKYTRPAVQIKIPNIQTGNGIARTFEEKC